MTKDLYVTVKSNWGKEDVYPDCELSRFFSILAGTKTLTPSAIAAIKKEGYTLNVLTKQI